MFLVPSDAIVDQCSSLNLIQLDHPNAIPPSPGISPSSSSASLSCSSISSLKAWRSASDQMQPPSFSFPHPVYCNIAAISSDEPSGQHISCIPMSASDVPSSQEPTISSVDEDELVDLHWTTGIPCHMMDVFRANPFAAVDLPRTTSITPPSLGNFTYPDSTQCKIGGLHHARSATKHVLSPDAVGQKRKTRSKRARIQPPVIPFPATGPQEMFAYEFRLDLEISCKNTGFPPDEDYRRSRDLRPSHSLAKAIDDRDRLHIPRPVVAYDPEDISMRSPLENEDVELSLLPHLPYPRSRTAPVPTMTRSEYRVQLPHSPFPFQLPTHMLLRLREPANSAPRQGIDEYQPQFNERGRSSLPPAVPMEAMPERAQAHRPPAMSAPSLIQKPLYACPLCPRDFQLPNGLALHLKWHDRVGNLTTNPAPSLSRRPQERATLKHPHTELNAHGVRASHLPAQSDGQRVGLPSIPYTTPQETNSAQADPMSHEQYTTSALSYERQPQECALFHDALQLTHNVDNNTYLAPLDGLSVLQPLPFEQCHTTTGQLCALSPP